MEQNLRILKSLDMLSEVFDMDAKNYIIRDASIEDAAGLNVCMNSAYSKYLDRLSKEQLPPMNINYKDEIELFPVWVAENDGEIVGGLILVFEEDYGAIANVAVRPDFQGYGLGKALLEFAQLIFEDKGYKEMRLATHVLLSENISYYSYLGWEEIDRDENRVYMKKMILE